MYDHRLFLTTLSNFAHLLPATYDVGAVLEELTGSITTILGLTGSDVSLAEDGRPRFATASSALEQ